MGMRQLRRGEVPVGSSTWLKPNGCVLPVFPTGTLRICDHIRSLDIAIALGQVL